jgi:WD40 repeat protein
VTSSALKEAAPPTPFKGLISYSEVDAEFFFGRKRECDAIIASLKARRLTLLYGESGVGKSSLLRAGVAARLRALARDSFNDIGTPEFVPVVFSDWRDDPISGLSKQITDSISEFASVGDRMSAAGPLRDVIKAAADRTDAYLLVVLDQFEDYFLYQLPKTDDDTFGVEFPQTLNEAGLPASFLISIREDALAKLDRFKRQIPRLFDASLRVRHLDSASARQAIVRPIERYNGLVSEEERVVIEPALEDAVIEQRVSTNQVLRKQIGRGTVNGSAGTDRRLIEIEAPYLQLVLTRLWEAELASGSRTMRLGTLERLGGAREIVRTHLDTALGDLPPGERQMAADIFHHLVTPSGAKIVHSVPDLAKYSGHSDAEVLSLLEKLAGGDARIVRHVPSPPGEEGPPRFEIYHDLLAAAILDWRNRQENIRLERTKELAEQKARTERARARRFRSLAIGALVLLFGAIAVFVFALARRAETQKNIAQSQSLASQAGTTQDLQLASVLAIEAYRLLPTIDARSAIATVAESHELRSPLTGHANFVSSVAFSRDGRTVASGGYDGTVRLWDVATHRQLTKPLAAGASRIYSVAFSPDGKMLASGSGDGTVLLWSAASQRQIGVLTGHRGAVNSVAFSPDGKMLASGGADDTIRLWDLAHQRQLGGPLTGHTGPIGSVAFAHAAKTIASGSWDGSVRLWDVVTHRQLGRPLTGHTSRVNSVAFSPDGKTLASGSGDDTVRLWNVAAHRQLAAPLTGHTDAVLGVAFSPDGRTLASGSDDYTVRLWDVATRHELGAPFTGHTNFVDSVAFSADGKTLASGSWDGTVRLWGVASQRQVGVLSDPSAAVDSVEFAPDGKMLASGSGDGAVRLWNVASQRQVGVLTGHGGAVDSVAFSRDGKMLASGSGDGAVRLWNVASERQVGVLTGHRDAINSVAFSPDGTTLASGSDDEAIVLWNVADRRGLGALPAGAKVLSVTFSPDGKTLASGGWDGTVRLWRVTPRREIRALTGHAGPVRSVAFSPDGKMLASGSGDHTIGLWDVTSGRRIGTLTGHTGPVRSVAFSPDGKTIAAGGRDDTVQLWDVSTHRSLGAPLTGHTYIVYSVSFSPDGKTIASGSGDHTIQLWSNFSTDRYIRQLCEYIDQRQALKLWQQAEPSIPYRRPC